MSYYLTDFFRSPHALADTDTNAPVLVALSGGADSCCLLHVLREYSEASGCKLYAAHVNHNIRTKDYSNEAERDERFCRALCERLGVELFVLNADVPAIAEQSGQSLETAARTVRYAFFADVMRERGIKILATAHNADDNLETQIFNICRGCGTDGLCGIPRTRPFLEADGIIVRPILDATKADILDFCRENGISYVTDSTNLEDDCTRNRIRHNIIPELVSLFGTPQRAAMRLAATAEQDVDLIKSNARQFIDSNEGRLPVEKLAALHCALMTRVISLSFKEKYCVSLESVHVNAITKLINTAKPESSVSLPCRARAVIRQGELIFEADTRDGGCAARKYNVELSFGINSLDGTDFAICVNADGESVCHAPSGFDKYSEATLYYSGEATLSARSRLEGDTVVDGGMHKKIKKLMCDKKIATVDRDSLPLVCIDGRIAYVPMCAVADDSKKDVNKKKIKISIYKKHGEDQI